VNIGLTTEWEQYRIPFGAVAQEGWGGVSVFDPAQILGVQFDIPQGVAFDFAIDDIGFYGGEPPPPATTNSGATTRPVLSGFRASSYGAGGRYTDSNYWQTVANGMASKFDTGTPAGIYIVCNALSTGDCSRTDFASNEANLNAFDAAGVKVFLQVESASENVEALIDEVLSAYGHHSSVIGFGVDVEFYWPNGERGPEESGIEVSDSVASSWVASMREYDPNYILMLKHFDPYRMPPCERDGMYFVNDSQGASQAALVEEFRAWADYFAPADVAFQIGYPNDQSWWSNFDDPPQEFGRLMTDSIANTAGIFWVDFTVGDVFP
jgi:hypothetical protein